MVVSGRLTPFGCVRHAQFDLAVINQDHMSFLKRCENFGMRQVDPRPVSRRRV